jgi:ABC-type antimicrobial peptide transport system permease subunit
VWLAGRPFEVVGVIHDADRDPRLLNAVVVSFDAATSIFGISESAADLVIRTTPGAAAATAQLAPYAVRPERPASIHVQAPLDLRNLRRGIATDLDDLILLVAGLVLLLGSMAITNAMTLSVQARRGEIGLRRALGASQRAIMMLFVVEGVIQGTIGGLAGAGIGMTGVVAIAATHSWTPVMSFDLAAIGVATGAVVGLAASLYPALRAARLEPVAAIRGTT